MKNTVLAGLGSLVLAGAASAAPVGLAFTLNTVTVMDMKYCVGRVYICYSNPNDVLLNAFGANIDLVGGPNFNHNDTSTGGQNAATGSWSPNAFLPAPFNVGNPSIDSWVTIGGGPSDAFANANATQNDPSFSATATGVNGGWFNPNPPNLQGKSGAVAGLDPNQTYTLIGQFVVKDTGVAQKLSVVIKQTSNQGPGTPGYPQTEFSGMWDLCPVPAPGALALLGLAGLAGGRRRRA